MSMHETIIVIEGFAFVPQAAEVHIGDTVRWINNDNTEHTTTSDTGVWDSGIIEPGQSFTRAFNTPGVFGYHCIIHPSMTGSITVGG